VNQVAAEKLPPDVPAFLRNATSELAYLGPEPDRWREDSDAAPKSPTKLLGFKRSPMIAKADNTAPPRRNRMKIWLIAFDSSSHP